MITYVHGNIATAELTYPIVTKMLCLNIKNVDASVYVSVMIMGSEVDCK